MDFKFGHGDNENALIPCLRHIKLSSLKYHNSWDSLIPVIKKIKDYLGTIYVEKNEIIFRYFDYVKRSLLSFDLDMTYKYVFEIIKIYNKKKLV